MTRYTVLWDAEVEARFINIWLAADSETRSLLTEIAHWVDTNLAIDPDVKGEERTDLSVRILPVPASPARVSVAFQVLPEDRQVRILRMVFRR